MDNLLTVLNDHYNLRFDRLELLRDMGSTSYAVFSGNDKYFLRITKPALLHTAISGADIQWFLQSQGFPVPPIVLSIHGVPYVQMDRALLILYEFIEGEDSNPQRDAERIGTLVGKLHQVMATYPGALVKRDKAFYIGRYIDILRAKAYPKRDAYIAYGDALWNKVKHLPWGYCHGDMYDGNIRRATDSKLYIHDFDTSCHGIAMYDTTLICDVTEYFAFDEKNYARSNEVLARYLPHYRKHHALSQAEIDAFPALVAMQHFSTQATIMEIAGLDCLDETDMDNQLDWLHRWREQTDAAQSF